MRHEGLGEHRQHPNCTGCSRPFYTPSDTESPPLTPPRHRTRCKDCFGDFVECVDCCVQRHARLPLHATQQWTGDFWKKRTLKDMGLVIQLGHTDTPCHVPASKEPLPVTIIDHGGIHELFVYFCGCERGMMADKRVQMLRAGWYPASMTDPQSCATFQVLDQFHMLNLVGGMNVHDFVKSTERLSDATKVNSPPVCHFAFGGTRGLLIYSTGPI